MNQENIHGIPDQELPSPIESSVDDGFNEAQVAANMTEKDVAANTASAGSNIPPQASASTNLPTYTPQASSGQNLQIATPHIADDEDLIEKEWVESAKRIVEQTKDDPYTQSESLSAVKKDYKNKRFNMGVDLGGES